MRVTHLRLRDERGKARVCLGAGGWCGERGENTELLSGDLKGGSLQGLMLEGVVLQRLVVLLAALYPRCSALVRVCTWPATHACLTTYYSRTPQV